LALAIAAWIKYVSGKDLHGKTIDVRDPLANDFAVISKNSITIEHFVDSILDFSEVFPANLRGSAAFREEIQKSYKSLEHAGILVSVEKLISTEEK
jgi:Mannitol-1-phosphate/altronate dehydrogenases